MGLSASPGPAAFTWRRFRAAPAGQHAHPHRSAPPRAGAKRVADPRGPMYLLDHPSCRFPVSEYAKWFGWATHRRRGALPASPMRPLFAPFRVRLHDISVNLPHNPSLLKLIGRLPVRARPRRAAARRRCVLLRADAPCLSLISEWVACARRLYGWSDLPAGAVDAQVRALVAAVAATPPALPLQPPLPRRSRSTVRAGRPNSPAWGTVWSRGGRVAQPSAGGSVETSRCRFLTALRANVARRREAVAFRGLWRASGSSSRPVPGERLPAPDAGGKPGAPGTFRPVIRRLGPAWSASRAPGP